MKLYAIVYLFGKIAAAVGPWPDDINGQESCKDAMKVTEIKTDMLYSQTPVINMSDEKQTPTHRDDWKFVCEWRDTPPKVELE